MCIFPGVQLFIFVFCSSVSLSFNKLPAEDEVQLVSGAPSDVAPLVVGQLHSWSSTSFNVFSIEVIKKKNTEWEEWSWSLYCFSGFLWASTLNKVLVTCNEKQMSQTHSIKKYVKQATRRQGACSGSRSWIPEVCCHAVCSWTWFYLMTSTHLMCHRSMTETSICSLITKEVWYIIL